MTFTKMVATIDVTALRVHAYNPVHEYIDYSVLIQTKFLKQPSATDLEYELM